MQCFDNLKCFFFVIILGLCSKKSYTITMFILFSDIKDCENQHNRDRIQSRRGDQCSLLTNITS